MIKALAAPSSLRYGGAVYHALVERAVIRLDFGCLSLATFAYSSNLEPSVGSLTINPHSLVCSHSRS
jgi:hypothetical protein